MDPDAVWNMITECLKELNAHPKNELAREKAVRCLYALGRWIKKDGLPPKISVNLQQTHL